MWPLLVIFVAVILDDDSCLREGPKLLTVEALVAEASVEGFHEAVLPGAAGLDVDGPDLVVRQPPLEFLGDKLRAVVAEPGLPSARDGQPASGV
jgi:hypothetical protein